LNIVWLTPETDRIFLEPPAVRRKFIDRLIYAEDPLHIDRVQRYEHALKERLMVLKNQNDARWLTGLEEQLATYGVAIVVSRQQLMKKLNKGQEYQHTLFPPFKSQMVGEVDQWAEEKSATEMESQLRQIFHQNRRIDQESGTTKCGPHRSDWQVIHQDKNIAAEFTSTGEQKILLMAVILSFIQNKTRCDHRLTILLLDDVIAHLDFHHRVVLFEQISALQFQQGLKSHIQTWLTGTDSILFEPLIERAQFFMVDHATITSG
jgi:DNA replication and repair protein RecF